MDNFFVANIYFNRTWAGVYVDRWATGFSGWGITKEDMVTDLVASVMGFDHVMDYLRNYPGHYSKESCISSMVGTTDDIYCRHWFSVKLGYWGLDGLSKTFETMFDVYGNGNITLPCILYPKLEHFDSASNHKYAKDVKYRWFCYDWKG